MIPYFAAAMAGWSIPELVIAAIVIAACFGILFVALKVFGVQIPPWLIQIVWIVVVAVVAIMAVKFVASL